MGNRDYYDQDSRTDRVSIKSIFGKPQVVAFLMTFTLVLAVGVPALFIFKSIADRPLKEPEAFFASRFEVIPEANVAENAAVTDEESAHRAAVTYEGDEDYTHVVGVSDEEVVTLGFAGDILFDTNYAVGDAFLKAGNTAEGVIGQSLLEKMRGVDIMMVNNEFPYSDGGTPLEGKTYTFWARGTTIQLYGFDYEAGQGQQGGGETKGLEDGTYFVSYNIDPALSNVTTDEMANTGTANNVATWDNGISVMIMRSDKGMSNGKAITIDGTAYTTIKVSNGAQNKLILPEGNVTKKVTFYSYVNKDAATERDSYWKEVAGVSYGTPDEAGGIFANYGEAEGTPDARTYEFAATNTVTFTNTGEQCCYVIAVEVESAAAGITNTQAANIVNGAIYNLAGQRVANGYRGIAIQNGKKVVIK